MTDSQLLLLPGLAADRRLLAPQRAAAPDLAVPDWLPPRPEEGLPAYAKRCAEAWVFGDGTAASPDRPFRLGGVSFGGMVALEIGRALLDAGAPPAGVFLIASCRSRDAVTGGFRLRASAGSLLPAGAVRAVLGGFGARRFARREGLTGDWPATLAAMGRDTNVPALFRFARMAAAWDLSAGEAARPGFPVYQIHGERDPVIPCRPQDCDVVLPGAGHLINVTHADAVNRFLQTA